ncbi:CapA family protein [Pseudochelatococcus sp. B33]
MLYKGDKGDIRMAFTGDTMLTRQLSPFDEPDYTALRELLRGADLAFTNLETNVREPHEGVPILTQGTPMTTPPELLADLQWLGFDLVSSANNHASDYGGEGMVATARHLRRAGLAYAGIGETLAQARAPGYRDTPAGRVGLVSVTSYFKPGDRAGDQRPDAAGRPGINPLGFESEYDVAEGDFEVLSRIGRELGLSKERERLRAQFFSESEAPKDSEATISLFGKTIRRGTASRVRTVVDRRDADANLRWIREARRQADWVLFSFHYHEFGSAGRLSARTNVDLEEPADFVKSFAREAIKAGADVVAGHGPHLTLGVELHDGRPILYSLGNFILQNDTVRAVPADSYDRFGLGPDATPADFFDARTGNGTRGFPAHREYWESYVAECVFTDWSLSRLRLHPIVLGHGSSRAQRGRPMLARGEAAQRIIERIARLSRPYGTSLVIDGDTADVRLS